MSDDESKDKGPLDFLRPDFWRKPRGKNDETQTDQEQEKEKQKRPSAPSKSAGKKEKEAKKDLPKAWAKDESDDEPKLEDSSSENKVIRLIPDRLKGNDGILDVLEQLLDLAAQGKLSYITVAYGIDQRFGRVESKAAWRVRDPGDAQSARDIVFALEQLKFVCLREWTDIERLER